MAELEEERIADADLPVVALHPTGRERKISRGQYMTIWEVTVDGRTFVGKKIRDTKRVCTINPEWITSLERGLQRECQLLRQLTHPSIVMVAGLSLDSATARRPTLVMEYMEDGNLDDFIASGKGRGEMDGQLQHAILLDVARGLQYMHTKSVVHYTLNSRKILLTFQRPDIPVLAKIGGFGAAAMECRRPHHLVADEESRTQLSQSVIDGYPPEVFSGVDANDPKTVDIFSFGLVILQTVTQESPRPKPPVDTHGRVLPEVERRLEHLDQLDDNHPLKQTVVECLSNDPQYRPTADDIMGIIERAELRRFIPVAEMETLRQVHAQVMFRLRSEKERLRGEKERMGQRLEELCEQNEEQTRDLERRVERLLQENSHQALELSILRGGAQRRPPLVQSISLPEGRPQPPSPAVINQPFVLESAPVEGAILRSEVQILHEVDRGAWAVVARGQCRGHVVAVKWPHDQLLRNYRDIVPRLEREISIMSQLRHPNLVHFVGAVVDDEARRLQGPPLLLTELLDTNLRREYMRCKTENISFGKHLLQSIFLDVAYGLCCLHTHSERIIHRDISAPNVLLKRLPNGAWQAKISDFGSANLVRCAQSLGEGSILYTAPEMFPHANQPNQTTKIDIFSYGILLCEAIAAELPIAERYLLMLQTVAGRWSVMYGLIERCTQHDPEARPTAAEIIDKLHQTPVSSLQTQVSF